MSARCQTAVGTAHETNETIGDIRRKNTLVTTRVTNAEQTREEEFENAKTVVPLLHYSARRDLHSGFVVGPERDPSRAAR
jgi:hypothetical protein